MKNNNNNNNFLIYLNLINYFISYVYFTFLYKYGTI